jgi:putative endopeptidase
MNLAACALCVLLALPMTGASEQNEAKPGLWRGIDYGGMNRAVDPITDFDLYASGNWYAKNPIPPEQGSWSTGQMVKQRNQEILRAILQDAAEDTNANPKTLKGRIGAFYRSAMNEPSIEAAGLSPLRSLFGQIDELNTPEKLWRALPGIYQQTAVFAPIPIHTDTDPTDNKKLVLVIDEGGMGLPDPDYYLLNDEKTKAIRARYIEHVRKMFLLLGDSKDRAAEEAQSVEAFESRLARASRTSAEEGGPGDTVHPMMMEQVDAIAPGLALTKFISRLGITQSTRVVVVNPRFLREVQEMLQDEAISTWQSYLRWQFIESLAPTLPKAFSEENFAFQAVLSGKVQDLPRWKRTVIWTDDLLGYDLGQLYVAQRFTAETKARATVMIRNIVLALRESIATRDWMSPSAKREALDKLDKVTFEIGYPDKWRDYSGLIIDDGPFVLNYLRAKKFSNDWMFSRLGKPRDLSEWEHTPPTINAYCDADTLKVVFSAGILQPPFFDPTADDEVNYAQIGSVIGHELTHLFRWTGEDAASFTKRAHTFEQQYSDYTLPDGLHVNGKLTLGENIADIGGLKLAYLAWKHSLVGKPTPGKKNGLTADQRFFIAYAQSWRIQSRPETARLRIATDPHAPGHYRIVGPLSVMPEFYQAFSRPGAPPRTFRESVW